MAAGRIVIPQWFPARDRNGRLVSGARLTVYVNGTTTKADIYSSSTLSPPMANPVLANASGVFPDIWAEAGSVETPTLYSVSVSGPNGESIANPGVLDDWQPSIDSESAQTAIAEASATAADESASDAQDAAAAAAATLADILAIQASGSEAAAIAARAARSANGSDFADRQQVTENLLFLQSGTGAQSRSLRSKIRETVSAFDFMTSAQIADVEAGTLGQDVTTALQAAVTACIASGKKLLLPAGNYRISSTLLLNTAASAQSLVMRGEGVRKTTITLYTASAATPAVRVGLGDNSSFIGGDVGGFTIVGNGGAAKGIGLQLDTTATNSAISQSKFTEIRILNVSKGVSKTGVIYMCAFSGITVTGSVTQYGWEVGSAQEIIYNSYTDLEVTAVENGAYAYYFQVAQSRFRNLTADGCIYFSNPYGCAKGITIEGIYATTVPSTAAITLNQCDALEDVALINCPTAKTSIGINVTGRCNIRNVRWPDSGAGNQPDNALYLSPGSKGTVVGYQTARAVTNKVEVGSLPDMGSWVFHGCADITDYDFYASHGTWTPTFVGWPTDPTTISAQWERFGRTVFVTAYFTNGVADAGDSIGGLPFTANSTQGAAAYGASNSTTKVISGSIVPSGTSITNMPALTLTGEFWQISATYRV